MSTENTQHICLNCQTELHGAYCHVCGQKATQRKPTVKEFILEYLNIAFVWDTHFIKTFWQLLRRPGHLTNEYVSGKFVSYTHPLKLNMFLLFLFVTLFVLFRSAEGVGDTIHDYTHQDAVFPMLQLESLSTDPAYQASVQSSERDTVQLYAPIVLPISYPEFITSVDEVATAPEDSVAVWRASVPRKLLEDKAIIQHADGYYYFNKEFKRNLVGTYLLDTFWQQFIRMITKYFAIIILLTAPLLSLVVRLVQRKGKHTQFGHFIFTLHYTAMLEIMIIVLYILHLIAPPPGWLSQMFLLLGSCVYLTIATRKVYGTRWIGAAWQATLVNLSYGLILSAIFFVICVITLLAIAMQGLQ